MRIFQLTAVTSHLALVIAVIGCSSAPDTTSDGSSESETVFTTMNTSCPIMGGKVTDKGGRTEWNGQTIGFCCPDCIPEWNDLSTEEKTSKLAEVSESFSDYEHGNPADQGSDHN